MPITSDPWSPFEPTSGDPWDVAKVAHLHRRAGFGATWAELQRDVESGPQASVDRFLNTPQPSADEDQLQNNLKRGAVGAQDSERLKAWWLYRILWGVDPLCEKLTLFWHGHFATSNRKVQSVPLMADQNELFRRLALGSFAELLTSIVSDPAMLIWLDVSGSRREKPNENFAREFLELFTLGAGHYTETDIREAARAFSGWVRDDSIRRARGFRLDRDRDDDGEKTFLGRTGPWTADDIVRITLDQPAAAEFLCRKLYRYFVSESDEPPRDAIALLADALRASGFSIRRVVELILLSQHFYSASVRRQRIASPVEFSAGLLRALEVPRRNVRLLALAAACSAQGQDLFYPPNVKGWDGGRQWLNNATLLSRGNWANDVIWGNAQLGMQPWEPQEWATHHRLSRDKTGAALVDLLLQDSLEEGVRDTILRTVSETSPNCVRKAIQLVLNCAECQLW